MFHEAFEGGPEDVKRGSVVAYAVAKVAHDVVVGLVEQRNKEGRKEGGKERKKGDELRRLGI